MSKIQDVSYGLSSPLQWVTENGSNIPLQVINHLENNCARWIRITAKLKAN